MTDEERPRAWRSGILRKGPSMARRATRKSAKTQKAAMPTVAVTDTIAPRLRLDGEQARPFLDQDPGEKITLEVSGTVRQVGLDRRLVETFDGKKPKRRDRPEIEIEVSSAKLLKMGRRR